MSRHVPLRRWIEKIKNAARLKGVECRELVESDLPACSRIAKQSFPPTLSDLLTGTRGFVLVRSGDVIGYVIINEGFHANEHNGGKEISGELTDAAILKPYRHWAGLLFLGASEYLTAKGGIWVADCLPETIYRFLQGAERRGFVTILDDVPVVFRGSEMRRVYFTVSVVPNLNRIPKG